MSCREAMKTFSKSVKYSAHTSNVKDNIISGEYSKIGSGSAYVSAGIV